ncbi:hypothetical protein NBO_22g0011 [Nosema bombycis CQ1]|uniref:Uncharacterized protein n=1 Tax=Nosema bombycis (strain CQ1 / CVCC 102059) TaxID=578461 RepID=R0M9E9_NOSB1|nr:hypothetical protein NBO_22g0011 [Nosema bombycis CQ1]|eukprot:EOB14609.1 hypothetical protein NBO_22g0011 [Nosema bombycis CQ1]
MEDYEREIKEKIKANQEKFTGFEYLLEYADINLDHLCTEDNCLVNFITKNENFIEDFEFSSILLSEKEVEEIKTAEIFENKYKNLIYKLKIISNQNRIDQKAITTIKNNISISFFEYSKAYLKFFRCIMPNERQCIRKFDLSTFYTVFNYNYIDENITNFIKRFADDPLIYPDTNKQDIIVILIYVLGFSKRNKLKYTNLISEKLRNNIIFTRNYNIYNLDLTNDLFIDKYILKLRKIEIDSPSLMYQESLFMNHIYSKFISKPKLEREIFQDFQNRLNKTINLIKEEYLMAFLKNVFFKHSVLYNCINNVQLVKAIIDFYGKLLQKNKTEAFYKASYDFFVLLSLLMPDLDLFEIIIQQTQQIFEGDKYFLLRLLSINKLSDINGLVETSKESFNLMKQVIDVYYSLLSSIQSNLLKKNKIN